MGRPALRGRSDYRAWCPIATRWHDNDAYGHVNNVVYYSWFDTAVNAWLMEVGLLDLEHSDPVCIVVETGCRYASSVAFPQKIEVGFAVAKLGTSSVTYHLGVFVEGAGSAAAEGHFTHVCVDRASQRPVPLPENWRTILARLT